MATVMITQTDDHHPVVRCNGCGWQRNLPLNLAVDEFAALCDDWLDTHQYCGKT